MQSVDAFRLAAVFVIALIASGGAIALLQPFWREYALARPNFRSSHEQPTPQGGGIAVLFAIACTLLLIPATLQLYAAFAAALALGAIGALDDLRALEALPRLIVQAAAAAAVVTLLPPDFHPLQFVPSWLERILFFFGLVWFVNITNFMDGIDWITLAEMVPITAALALFGLSGALAADAALMAAALCGALIGFAPFNKPVARLFLGDVGSLPIGLLTGWLLIRFAEQHTSAAVLLPLYYIGDATITLFWRLARGEAIMQAHRQHFYQRAVDGCLSVKAVVARIVLLNALLIALSALCLAYHSVSVHLIALTVGCLAVAATLFHFARSGKLA